jgi:tRNA pseudouridine55 synthase
MSQYNGILLCDKSIGISSHDLVSNLRRVIGQKKIGHTGTLDPLASGLIVVCLGSATKITRFISDTDKTYSAEIKLGQTSPTFDGEGIVPETPTEPIPELNKDDLIALLNSFRGEGMQKVPAYSAVKIRGKRLYKLARKGETVETPERGINILDINLISMDLPYIKFEVTCSKGTYIRSLANDIGNSIGCGAYLSALRRIRVGRFSIDGALTLDKIALYCQSGELLNYLEPIESALLFPSIVVNDNFGSLILLGRPPRREDIIDIDGKFLRDQYINLRNSNGKIMAIGKSLIGSSEIDKFNGESFFSYIRVLN